MAAVNIPDRVKQLKRNNRRSSGDRNTSSLLVKYVGVIKLSQTQDLMSREFK